MRCIPEEPEFGEGQLAEKAVWDAQLLLCTQDETEKKPRPFKAFVVIWEPLSPSL